MSGPASCYDWPALTAHRRDRLADEPAAWREALAHLDGCTDCRRAALAADPTLLFQSLAAREPRGSECIARQPRGSESTAHEPRGAFQELDEQAEVESALQAFTAMRAARRVAGLRGGLLRRAAGVGRWAAAAALAFVALSLENVGLPDNARATFRAFSDNPRGVVEPAAVTAALPAVSRLPLVEGINGRPEARIYHLGGDDLSVVMIVDESLDV